MPQGFYRELIELLKAAGCVYRREGKGDHEIWFSPVSNRTFTVDKKLPITTHCKRSAEAGGTA